MASSKKKKYNRFVITVASVLTALCLIFIAMLLEAANDHSFLVVFVLAFLIAIIIIFFTAKDMLKK